MSKELLIPILNDEYKVIVCWGSSKSIKRVLESWSYPAEEITSSLFDCQGVCFLAKECHPVIALPERPQTAEQIGTLAHEAVHAIEDIFLKVNQPLNGEIFAHCVGAIVRGTLRASKRNK